MDINIYSKDTIKREILVYSLGYMMGIKHKVIPLDSVYQDPLFRIRLLTWVEENNFDNEFADFIHEILELEDILSIIPNKFNNEINKLIDKNLNYLAQLPLSSDNNLYFKALKSIELS